MWLGCIFLSVLAILVTLHYFVKWNYLPLVHRIFVEKPFFFALVGQPVSHAEDVRFSTANGLNLAGCYVPAAGPRKGVILFGPEFGSNRWSAVPYCEFLREAGYDIFSFECRSHGESDPQPDYDPLHWVTQYEVEDFQAALAYLKSRPDADPRGVGLFGISKGGSAALIAAADPYMRCFVVDGIFASHSTMLPYMRKWVDIALHIPSVAPLIPTIYLKYMAGVALRQIEQNRRCRFPHLECAISKLAPRPLLMIHGGGDSYIKPTMARELFDLAGEPKEFWLVENAKHNQAFNLAGDEYKRRVLQFFDTHLAAKPGETPSVNGSHSKERPAALSPSLTTES
jgi:uncharacterized protein